MVELEIGNAKSRQDAAGTGGIVLPEKYKQASRAPTQILAPGIRHACRCCCG